ncbi:nitrite reductase [Shewanella sp. WXL01]|uniref:nitrite reductase n=1 Tax=Shewanella sp. WXL01 TaxID=2709721 RepID=UPI00143864B3|nr:nitrite reductase [Shewanella sp. WXL01]NKF49611.1 nitrite reductase [Shewanella sp. WXL01]
MDISQVLIVAIVFFAIFGADFFKYRLRMKQLEAKIDSSDKMKLIDEVESLKHRLVVLERIVTDKGYEVNESINQLKD